MRPEHDLVEEFEAASYLVMGVRGLKTHFKAFPTLWTQINLKNTKLIIDGSSLCNNLYSSNGLDCRCGGQYREYYDAVVSFFRCSGFQRRGRLCCNRWSIWSKRQEIRDSYRTSLWQGSEIKCSVEICHMSSVLTSAFGKARVRGRTQESRCKIRFQWLVGVVYL